MFRPPPDGMLDMVRQGRRRPYAQKLVNRADVDRRLGFNQGSAPRRSTVATGGSGGRGSGGTRSRVPALRYRNQRRGRRSKRRGRRGRKSRKSKMRPVDHSKMGVSTVYEVAGVTGGADDDAEAIYIGHSNMPAGNMLIMAIRALIKSTYARFGVTIRSFFEPTSVPGTFQFVYYTTPVTTTQTGITVPVTGGTTYNDIVGALVTPLITAIDANPGLRPYSIIFAPTNGVRRQFYTDSVSLTFTALSRLKLQNRTPNEGGTDAVDTNDVNFLVGSVYSGSGTGTYITAVTEGTPHQPLIGTDGSGRILMSRADNMSLTANFLRHPPENTKFFTRVKHHSSIKKFAPGATKFSSLYTHRKISFAQMIDMYLKDVTTNAYTLSTMGQFRFFGLQKFIDDDASVKVKIAYEVELQLGVTCSMRTNVHTQPVYIETTEAP